MSHLGSEVYCNFWFRWFTRDPIDPMVGIPFGNRRDWQFGWPTDSLIFHIRQYIQFGNYLLVFPYYQ